MTLNDTIRALRRERGMTQEQLAEAMNVSAAAVSKWENGQSVPDILVLTALADFFEVSLDALVGYTVQAHRRGDMVARIRQLVVQKKHTEATRAAREAAAIPTASMSSMKRRRRMVIPAWSRTARRICARRFRLLNARWC